MNTLEKVYHVSEVADICGVSKETIRKWDRSGKLKAMREDSTAYRVYDRSSLEKLDEARLFFSHSEVRPKKVKPKRNYSLIELFAGAGGLALGLERNGFESVLLNEIDRNACKTLRHNRPKWNVVEGPIESVDFTSYHDKIDVVTGGFPCQSFSYAGKKRGFEDTRGTLFFEYARCLKEVRPKVFLGENVRGLLRHDQGRTLQTMLTVLKDLGYKVFEPRVLKAMHHRVPQKRERLIIVGVRDDLSYDGEFEWPVPTGRIYTLRDALKKGDLYPCDVPDSEGQTYPEHKKAIMELIPPGGYWRDLPLNLQKSYMKKSFYLGGGKTGMARRMNWDEPSLTLTTAPAQKQTERCHPDETRPFTTKEYARVQTFPDEWFFEGSQTAIYKQIGNAVPVNLAEALGQSLVRLLNSI
ncbi:MAG: DNA (cytosine-5-)-methyltransferase [Verrucomicrobiales bacterium]|nr:DNA (cytosine-5-)-methyltransferase [Verrucomicrobiales bacterium]